jgi:acetyl-CoA synthetase
MMGDDDSERSAPGDDVWGQARAMLDGLDGGLNIAHETLDRHVAAGHGGQVALRWIGKDGASRDLTYADMAGMTSRFANVLAARGIGRGDSLFCLMGRVPELYVAALGALKAGAVFTPLFSAFGPSRSGPAWKSARRAFWSPRPGCTSARSRPGATRFRRLNWC